MLIANRNGMVVREPLPYDAEVQYLQSTGTQYIDTGIYCLKKYSFEFEVSVSYDGVSYEDYFGGSPSDSQAGWRFRRDGNSEKVLFSIGNAYTTSGVEMSKNTPHLIAMDGSGTATIDGTSVTLSGTSILFDSSVSLYLFAYSKNNTPYRISNAKFYSFKCTDTDTGMVVMDMIPVRKNGVGYMYDRVSGTLFGNDGTGAFLYGQDVTPAFGYVHNGLIAMWDGIENAGWGVHDAATATWKDLIGNNDLDIYGSVEPNCVRTTNTSAAGTSGTISGISTIECCCKIDPTSGTSLGLLAYSGIMDTTHLGLVRYGPDVGFQTYSDIFWGYSDIATEAARTVTATTSACYVDGVGLQSASHSVDQWNNQSYTGIGGRHWQNHNYRAVGDYYCVRFYNRALTAAEIAANHAIDKTRFNLP